MNDSRDINPQDSQQLAHLLLLSPQTGEAMTFCSPMKANPDGSFSFLVGNPATGERYRITVRVEEIGRLEPIL